MNRTAHAWLAEPKLAHCQLSKRIALAHARLRAYPADTSHYGLMDIEPKDQESRHASQCTGDMSGRILEFYSASDGIYGEEEPRFHEHFFRLLRAQNNDGSFNGPDGFRSNNGGKILEGLVLYYKRTGDPRALNAAEMLFDRIYETKDEVYGWLNPDMPQGCVLLPQGIALYYEESNDPRCIEMLEYINAHIGQFDRAHSHGMTTMHRAMMQLSRYTGDMKYADQAEAFRRKVIEEGCLNPLGDVCECFPVSARNEGCSIADWIMLNLQAGLLYENDEAYALAENSLINALYFNQIVTGGFSHRAIRPWGYATDEFQEPWWCCTMNCGTGMSEYARHTVTASAEQIRINFLTPGDFTLPDAKVHIYTKWPDACDTRITIDDSLKRKVHIRIPKAMKNAKIEHFTASNGSEIWTVTGRIGYTMEAFGDKWVLKYGAAVMVPMNYTWGGQSAAKVDDGVPKNYIPARLPSKNFSILTPAEDADGFVEFAHKPLPEWSYYGEGPIETLSLKKVTANVPVRFEDGTEQVLRFWPVLANTATLCFYEIPIVFGRIDV